VKSLPFITRLLFHEIASTWDQGKTLVGLDNKNRNKENKFEKIRKGIEKQKDEDIKRELRRGNILTIIEGSFDY
jgi:hypothetical protein